MTRRSSKRRSSRRPVRPNFDVGPSGRTFEETAVGEGTRERPIVIEKIDDVDAFLGSPGFYQTTSAFPAYAVFKALDGHPRFRAGMDLYYPEGTITFARVIGHGEPEEPLVANRPRLVPNDGDDDDVGSIDWDETPDFYANLTRDYGNWQEAWWREVIQNARDGGATRMELEVVEDEYVDPWKKTRTPCMRVTAQDNGTGMTKDILLSAFFRKGGSYKPLAGSAGGFGDAKTLILVTWLGYEVRTQDVIARGSHHKLVKPIRTGEPFLQGTRVTVWMPLEKSTSIEHAQHVVECSGLNISVLVNGKTVSSSLPDGELKITIPIRYEYNIDSFIYTLVGSEMRDKLSREEKLKMAHRVAPDFPLLGEMRLYHAKDAPGDGRVYVRSRGIFTWAEEGEYDFPGVVIVEVDAPPIFVFNSKRNGFSHDSNAVAAFKAKLMQLAKESGRLLNSGADKQRVIYWGAGTIKRDVGRVAEIAARAAAGDRALTRRAEEARRANRPLRMTREEAAEMDRRIREARAAAEAEAERNRERNEAEDEAENARWAKEHENDEKRADVDEEKKPLPAPALPNSFSRMMAGRETYSEEQLTTAIKVSAAEPHFMVIREIAPWTVPPELEPDTMSLDYYKLRYVWTEICKFLVIQLNMDQPWGVGWIVDNTDSLFQGFVAGAHVKDSGISWLMINPIQITELEPTKLDAKGRPLVRAYRSGGPMYDLTNKKDLQKIAAIALHEITHMQGFSYHDSSFALAENENMPAYGNLAEYGFEKFAAWVIEGAEKNYAEQMRVRAGGRVRKPRAVDARLPWDVVVGRVAAALKSIYSLDKWDQRRVEREADASGVVERVKADRTEERLADALEDAANRLVGDPDAQEIVMSPAFILSLHDALVAADVFTRFSSVDAFSALRGLKDVPADPRGPARGPSKPRAAAVPWNVILGRVAAIMERLGRDGIYESDIPPAVEAALAADLPFEAEYLTRHRREGLRVDPAIIVKLHDAAAAREAFKRLDDAAAEAAARSVTWEGGTPVDPRPTSRRSSKPKTPKDTGLPSDMAVLSWHRDGNEWVLREGYLGQRGQEIGRFAGDASYGNRRRQRDARDFFNGRPVGPDDDNMYVWLSDGASGWYLRLRRDGTATRPAEDADFMARVEKAHDGSFDVFSGDFPALRADGGSGNKPGFRTAAEAQKYVMGAVVRQRAEG